MVLSHTIVVTRHWILVVKLVPGSQKPSQLIALDIHVCHIFSEIVSAELYISPYIP